MGDKNAVSPVKYFICGAFGGVCAVGVNHPLEMMMSTPSNGVSKTVRNVPEMFTHFVKTFRNEGLKTIYRGCETRFASAASASALTFFGYGLGRRILQEKPSDELLLPELFLAGAFSGFLKTLLLPLKNDTYVWSSLKHSVKTCDVQAVLQLITKSDEIRNAYRGSKYAFYREIPMTGLYFMTYDGLRQFLVPKRERSDICVSRTVVAGGIAGVVFSAAGIIADRLHDEIPPGSGFKGMKDYLTHLRGERGISSLYKGYAPVMIRAFPVSAACFLGFQTCLKALNWLAPNPL